MERNLRVHGGVRGLGQGAQRNLRVQRGIRDWARGAQRNLRRTQRVRDWARGRKGTCGYRVGLGTGPGGAKEPEEDTEGWGLGQGAQRSVQCT